MSLLLGDMLVRYKCDITDLTAKTAMAMGEVDGFGSGAKLAGATAATALIATGVAVAGVAVASTKMAADFQTAMLSNVAHAGLAKSEFDHVSQSVLAMSSAVGRSPTQLAEALYPILSSFSNIQNQSAKSAISLLTLKDSFQAVAGTTTDGTAVAQAAVGTFNALGLATNNVSTNTQRMTNLFDVMDKTTQLGNMQWETYKNVVSKLAVAIQGTGISFNESQAALAEMTNEGFSAQKASTYLANTFTTLSIKTDTLAKHAKGLKISFDENKYASMDFAGKIEYLNQVTDGNKQKLLALMGNNSTALKTFNALSIGIGGYKTNLDALNHAQGALAYSFDTASKGFNFQMQQVKAGGDALMITIGTQLLPIASGLLAKIVPLIGGFTKWLTEGDRLKNTIIQVVTALTNIGNTIGGVVSGFASFVGWLQQGSPLATAVGIALLMIAGGFAAIQIGAFIAAVPAIVGGFIAWSVAAWSAAIATIAATWPIFLIGAAVVLVVALIVIAVKNWGAISHWLVGAWKAAIGWLGGALNSIGQFFVGVWNWIKNATTSAWNFIVNAVKIGVGLFLAIFLGPFIAIGALFIWLYSHNTYVKQLVDSIVGFVKAGMAWLTNAFESAFQWVVGKLNWFKDMNVAAFNMVYNAIRTALTAVYGFVVGIVSTILGFFTARWNELVFTVTYLWTRISNIFSSAWNTYIAGPLGRIQSGVTNWLSGLVNGALNAGKNFINMLVQGITSGAGAIWNAVSGIAKNIWSALGFHSPPPDGPAKDSDKWMPNFIGMLVRDLNAGAPKVQKAAQQVAAPLQGQFQYPIRPSAVAVAAASQNTSRSSDQQVIIVEFDGTEITRKIMTKADRLVRLKIGANGRAA